MNRNWLIILILGLFLICVAGCEESSAHQIFRDMSYLEALKQAEKESKAVMLQFGTAWCGYCRKMDSQTFSKSSVQRFLLDNVIAIKINAEKNPDLRRLYGARAYPTTVFVDSEGIELGRMEGYCGPSTFLRRARTMIPKG